MSRSSKRRARHEDLIAMLRKMSAQQSSEDNDFWFKKQIVQIARQLNYYADTRTYSSWVRLKIREERQAGLQVALVQDGREFFRGHGALHR